MSLHFEANAVLHDLVKRPFAGHTVIMDESAYDDLSLVLFGVYCLMLGWLVWRSGFLPRVIGMLMVLAGVCYLINSLADLAAPALASSLSPHLMDPTLIGETALAIWLALFGAKDRFRDRKSNR